MEGQRRKVDGKELEQSSQKELDPKAVDDILTIELETFLSLSPLLPSLEVRFRSRFAWSRQGLCRLR